MSGGDFHSPPNVQRTQQTTLKKRGGVQYDKQTERRDIPTRFTPTVVYVISIAFTKMFGRFLVAFYVEFIIHELSTWGRNKPGSWVRVRVKA